MDPFVQGFLSELEKEAGLGNKAKAALVAAGIALPMMPMPSDYKEGKNNLEQASATRDWARKASKELQAPYATPGMLTHEDKRMLRGRAISLRNDGIKALAPGPHQVVRKYEKFMSLFRRK